jgi:hypothetical protein
MQRPDSTGHVSGKFSNGDPANAVISTVVDEKWLNSVSEEVANVIEKAGMTLVAPGVAMDDIAFKTDQLFEAITKVASSSSATVDLLNNQTTETIIVNDSAETVVPLDKTKLRSAVLEYEIYRKTATTEIKVIGRLTIAYKPVADTYKIIGGYEDQEDGELDHGITFSIVLISGNNYALNYKSTNLTGGSYIGNLSYSLKSFLNT